MCFEQVISKDKKMLDKYSTLKVIEPDLLRKLNSNLNVLYRQHIVLSLFKLYVKIKMI